jgi:glyoxylate/hydroxypyruvate reductase
MAGWEVGSCSMSILYRSDEARAASWARYFAEHAPDLNFRVWPDAGDLSKVEYVIAWQVPPEFLARLPRLKVLFSSGAGIDHIDFSTVPAHIPVVRMVEPGIINGMVEYVSLAVLALHRDLFDYFPAQAARVWAPLEVPPASARTIGVMGMGSLGRAVLERLGTYGFRLRGWNRSLRVMQGVESFAGDDQLPRFLERCDVLVCLLPLTPATRGVLNKNVFSALPVGASVINVGRGPHLVDADLLEALDSGRLARAILDVTDPEPLPPEHPFWTHPRVFLTPHVASMTQPETAAPILLENIRRHQRGEPLADVIDRDRGY